MINSSRHTTIESLFYVDILIIKLCGGLMFNTKSYLAILYRLSMMIVNRYVFSRFVFNVKFIIMNDPDANWDNIEVFGSLLSSVAISSLLVSLYTGSKYRTLLRILLMKRLDKRLVNIQGLSSETSSSHDAQTHIYMGKLRLHWSQPNKDSCASHHNQNSSFRSS